ncbi:MAG: PCMD domain-containing protein [Rikenellaceae bacterium]
MRCKQQLLVVISLLFIFSVAKDVSAQEKIEPVEYGDMNSWLERTVKESFVIGGKTKTLYEIAPKGTLPENTAYVPHESRWATSTVYARVSGINKASISVFPEPRGDGQCARLETVMENVKVLGVINISVLATGTIFLGEVNEPVRDTKNPQAKLMTGIPYTKRPKALMFDYKVDPKGPRIIATGFSRQKDLPGQNAAEAVIILQQRWEDAEGNLYAKRVATAWHRFDHKQEAWHNGYRMDLRYGDITKRADFKPFENLVVGENQWYCKNSKGEVKPINEIGWADASTTPTHIILRFTSGFGGAYIGSVGSKFWIDNIKLVY